MNHVRHVISWSLVLSLLACMPEPAYELTVEAGPYERAHTFVFFAWPDVDPSAAYVLVDEWGQARPVQAMPDGQGGFVLDHLAAGEQITLTLQRAKPEMRVASLTVEPVFHGVVFQQEEKPIMRYQAEDGPLPDAAIDSVYLRGGYVHPVYTPRGIVVTDDYPPNHLHHHGIWAAWTKTQYQSRTPDFWNMGVRTGTVLFESLDTLFAGPVMGGLIASHRYVDLTASEPLTVLREQWAMQVYRPVDGARPYHVFDLVVTQQVVGNDSLKLPEYRYGGVGFRGHRQWDGSENTFFLTSEGRNRSDGHATRARWCHIGGYVEGHLAGIAILGHPDNIEAPQPMRIHPTEPFFNWAPSQAGDWAIAPDEPLTLRYRYVVYDGEPDADELDRLWNDYAFPPKVTVAVQ